MTPPTKSAKTLATLRGRLADGTWPVGTRLPTEFALATELGVGRNTLREALRTLTNQGLLRARAGDGTYVLATDELAATLSRHVSKDEALRALEVRAALEIQAARLAAERITEAELERLDRLAEAREAAATGDDDLAFVRADLDWHECVVAASRNSLLCELYAGLDRAAAYTRTADPGPPRLHRPASRMDAAHTAVVTALRARDGHAAADAARDLIDISTSLLSETDSSEALS